MTSEHCTSGTDRVFEAFGKIKDNDNINYVVNVQGDMPFVKPEAILNVIESLKNSYYGITTPVAKVDMGVAEGDSNVKVVITHDGKALYFSRNLIPYGAKEFLYHVGVYGFRKDVLSTFVGLPQSVLEKSERLEQLRALENGIDIGVCYVNDIPISVDTPEDLAKAIEFYHQYIKK
jgi:3-deoxy-manno-octulosonate cytidylyltransferase (CMP-KDO synthetase)